LAKRGPGAHWSHCALDDIYCYAEHDSHAVFDQQVRAMRQWMRDHGQQYKPLILSEFFLLYRYRWDDGTCFQDERGNCFDPQRVKDFLNRTTAYLESETSRSIGNPLDGYRLVQQWAW
jgi:hypothetical protein